MLQSDKSSLNWFRVLHIPGVGWALPGRGALEDSWNIGMVSCKPHGSLADISWEFKSCLIGKVKHWKARRAMMVVSL